MANKDHTEHDRKDAKSGSDGEPFTQAGAPQRQDQSKTSLDTTSESGRARDEGPDRIERTTAQRPKRGADATATSDIDPDERETL